MTTKRGVNKTFLGVMLAILGLASFVLILFSPQVSTSARLIFIAVVLGAGWLILHARLERYFKQSLGRDMRAAPLKREGVSKPLEQEATSGTLRMAPAHPFTYQVFDVSSKFESSAATDRLLKRSYSYYHQYVLNLVIGALSLCAALLMLSFIGNLLLREPYLDFDVFTGSILLLLPAFFLAPPRRYLATFTFSVWFGLNLIFLAPIVYIAIKSFLQALTAQAGFPVIVVFVLAGGTILAYGLLTFLLASSLRRQIVANKPLHLLFLWVFNSGINVKSTMLGVRSIWRFLGTMQFLRGGDLTVDMGEIVRKDRADLVVDTPQELERSLRAFRYTPNWLGTYAQNTLLCGDAVWKAAVHAFLREADVVAMNLFKFSPSNQGCLYELGLLVDTFPLKRMLFLVDHTTDLQFLLTTLKQNWSNMSVDSPNYTDAEASVRIYQMGDFYERLTKNAAPGPRKDYLAPAVHLLTTVQSEAARQVDGMMRLMLEGIIC